MCEVCGCNGSEPATITTFSAGHEHTHADGTRHSHPHAHDHSHADHHPHGTIIDLQTRVLSKNDGLAQQNRSWLRDRGIIMLNLMSAPGAGKTSLLERTIRDARLEAPLYVVEGDQATANDGERIRAAGAPVVQVNTGTGCHLDADMIFKGLEALRPASNSLVVVENVGNLVCPALFDLGETKRIVVLSVTEGDDKPLKYPHMFHAADLVVINKIDLLPYVDFDVGVARKLALRANPDAMLLPLSARTGEGMADWYAWLEREFASGGVSAA